MLYLEVVIMMRLGSSRNQKSKGLRLKNILQICILAVVFFWLLYQLKHSYDKKKGSDERRSRILHNVFDSQSEFGSLGRKHLPHDKVMVSSHKSNKKDENEDVDEDEDGESQRLMEDDEAKGTGDDGFDEQDNEQDDEQDDQEGGDEEADDREEIVVEEKDDQVEEADFLEDQEGEDGSSSETHEKSYKKDDASSAVPQESQVQTEGNSVDKENLRNNEKDVNTKGYSSARNNTPTDNNSTRSIVVTVGVWNDTIQNKSLDENGVADGQIMPEFSPPNDQPKLQTNSTIASVSDKEMNMQTYLTTDATIGEKQGKIISLEDGTLTKSSDDDQNTRVILGSPEEDKTSLKSLVEPKPNRSNTTTGQDKLDESSTASLALDDNGDAVVGDSAGSSHTSVIEEEREPQIDQLTLPDMQNDVKNMDDEAAE